MDSVVISSGHAKYVSGAIGILNEVTEARKVVPQVAKYLKELVITVYEFHDDTSKTQKDNINTIVKYHNSKKRDLDVSVHFNSGTKVTGGVEVLYCTDAQKTIATKVSSAISNSLGIRDRGAKKRNDLGFLNGTKQPAILIEVCFVDVKENADAYHKNFDACCRAIAETITNKKLPTKATSNDDGKRYRLYTGTFATKVSATAFKEKVEKEFDITLQIREE
ncbi:N-acetylmuramoyl-L-alanine amidase [Bacillus massiliigorillae]|uniref:N-acetylmuramoyl-L-alanine amidase n=1 Tax=Bacillus massiliigorillae TaxID=1243664 RepID=UPI00039D6DAC|nr:N-acetylmuramoyl-L-alanine amidase [Bacillus massiliigorillae]